MSHCLRRNWYFRTQHPRNWAAIVIATILWMCRSARFQKKYKTIFWWFWQGSWLVLTALCSCRWSGFPRRPLKKSLSLCQKNPPSPVTGSTVMEHIPSPLTSPYSPTKTHPGPLSPVGCLTPPWKHQVMPLWLWTNLSHVRDLLCCYPWCFHKYDLCKLNVNHRVN